MPSDVASDEHLQSLLLPFPAFLAPTTAIIHFSKRSLQPEPPQFALLKKTLPKLYHKEGSAPMSVFLAEQQIGSVQQLTSRREEAGSHLHAK
jgi:hypothetical protein